MSEIAERAKSDRRIALGAALGLGIKPERAGNAVVVTEDEAVRVIEILVSTPLHRRPPKRTLAASA